MIRSKELSVRQIWRRHDSPQNDIQRNDIQQHSIKRANMLLLSVAIYLMLC
jgi:hypothetical protein